jgi:hypothetical protein
MLTMPICGYGYGNIPNKVAPANPGAVLGLITGMGILAVPLLLYGANRWLKWANMSIYNICTGMILLVGLFEYIDAIPKLYHLLATIPAFTVIEILDNKKGEV